MTTTYQPQTQATQPQDTLGKPWLATDMGDSVESKKCKILFLR